jgi:(p)ppGpp synthase/HD superfamily hydrolase
MLQRAREFAIVAHGDQKYGNDRPYSFHLDAVVKLLEPYGEEAQVLGYLHDIIEDARVDAQTLENEFGVLVATRVALLTDEPGESRQVRKRKTYERLKKVTGEGELSLVVLAADRLANIQACIADGTDGKKKLAMYRGERSAFKSAVYRPGLCDELWHTIDATWDSVDEAHNSAD